MAGKTATRADLVEAVYHVSGLPRHEAATLVQQVLGEISDALVSEEDVKLSGFGVFTVQDKAERVAIRGPVLRCQSSHAAPSPSKPQIGLKIT